jgi:exonuclease III
MRIVTWNCCRGQFARKVPLLARFAADIAVIQECAKPDSESEQCIWFGDNPRQGLAVIASGAYKLRQLPLMADTPKFIIPVEVTGPRNFVLFAVWTHAKQEFRYVEAAARAVDMYREVIATSATIMVGDFNSNARWDSTHPVQLNHTSLVSRLSALKMVSAYHFHTNEQQGCETIPTYFFHWKRERPYHIDYCFVPDAWAQQIVRVELGGYDEWRPYSDHCPLLVEFDDGVPSTVNG